MVLKKPYAFLIKYFKLIHLFLTLLFIYLSFQISNILFFFNNFIKTNKFDAIANLPNKYIGIILYLALLIILGLNIFIILLMRFKKKPITFYIINIIFTIALFFILILTHNNLYLIEINLIDVKNIRINRDIIFVSSLISYGLVLMNLYRASGFNLKKFNFDKDKEALLLEENDNEEVEVNLEFDTDELLQKVNKRRRILKYFYIENKFIINFILTTAISFFVIITVLNYTVINKKYKENQLFVLNGIKYQVINSYKTNLSYNGENIGKNKYYYTIVKLELENLTAKDIVINKNNFRLKVNNKYFDLNQSKANYFFDLGKVIDADKLKTKEKKEYILVFEYDKNLSKGKQEFQIFKKGNYKKKELFLNYNKVVLKTNDFIKHKKDANMNEELILESDVYKNSSIKIKEFEFEDKFFYKYNFCINDKCNLLDDFIKSTNNNYVMTLLKLDIDIKYDDKVNSKLTKDQFIYHYGSFKYVKNKKEYDYDIKLVNKTPNNNNFIYFEVSKVLENTDELYLILNIRNEEYQFKLK